MAVKNPRAKGVDELHVIHALVAQMRWVIVEAEALVSLHRLNRPLGGGDIERDFRGVDFQREIDIGLVKLGQDRAETLREVVEPFLPVFLIGRRKGVDAVPDARTGETVDNANAELLGGAGRILELFGCATVDAAGIAVAPHVRRQNRAVPLIDAVADDIDKWLKSIADTSTRLVIFVHKGIASGADMPTRIHDKVVRVSQGQTNPELDHKSWSVPETTFVISRIALKSGS